MYSRLVFIVGKCAVVVHLPENIFLALFVFLFAGVDPFTCGVVLVAGKRIQRFRAFRNRRQAGGLCHIQILCALSEVLLGGMFNAVGSTAETDVVHVGLQDLVLGISTFQFHRTENFPDLTGRGLLAVAGDVLDELLCNGRTALVGIVNMHEHIDKSGNSTLIVYTVVGVETLILGTDESISRVLGNIVNADGNALRFVGDLINVHPFAAAVLGIDVGIVGQLHLLNGDIRNIVPEVHDIYHQRSCHNGAGDNQNHEKRRQGRTENGKRTPQNRKTLFLDGWLVQFRTVIGIVRRAGRSVVFPHRNAAALAVSVCFLIPSRLVSFFVVIHIFDSFQKPSVPQVLPFHTANCRSHGNSLLRHSCVKLTGSLCAGMSEFSDTVLPDKKQNDIPYYYITFSRHC